MTKPLKTQGKKPVDLLIENQLRDTLRAGEMTPTPLSRPRRARSKRGGGHPPHPIFNAGHSDPIQHFEADNARKKTRISEICNRGAGVCL